MPQQFFLLGLNHDTAPVDVREKCVLGPDDVRSFLRRSQDSCGEVENVVLSTCNRTEIYARFPAHTDVRKIDDRLDDLIRLAVNGSDSEPDLLAPHFYRHHCDDAILHLFRLAGGLDSMIVGEGEILHQIREAFEMSRQSGAVGWFFHRLFPAAIKAGRRIRTDTNLSRGCITTGQAAFRLAQPHVSSSTPKVLVIGSGDIARLATQAIREANPETIFVVNRSPDRAAQLVAELGAPACQRPWEDIDELLVCVDVVISSTGAPHSIVTRERFDAIQPRRSGRPLTVIDLAVPRDFDASIGNHDDVHLYNIDDLRGVVQKNIESRRTEIPRAETIVQEEIQTFFSQMNWSHLEPVIRRIRGRFDLIREREIHKITRSIPEEYHDRIDRFSHDLMNKFLHFPIDKLKSLRDGQDLNPTEIAFLQRIFLTKDAEDDLENPESDGSGTTDRNAR
jgi:glutamyl-tRNA reductase